MSYPDLEYIGVVVSEVVLGAVAVLDDDVGVSGVVIYPSPATSVNAETAMAASALVMSIGNLHCNGACGQTLIDAGIFDRNRPMDRGFS